MSPATAISREKTSSSSAHRFKVLLKSLVKRVTTTTDHGLQRHRHSVTTDEHEHERSGQYTPSSLTSGSLSQTSLTHSTSTSATTTHEDDAFVAFLKLYPEYAATSDLDDLRATSYTRLGKQVYVDYMGGSLLPESLVQWHSAFLQSHVMGNTHSISKSSQISSTYAASARKAVLRFFDAPEDLYTVVFTSSATAALKLVGESFPFTSKSCLVLPADAHNSVHGIRSFANRSGARVRYLECLPRGGVNLDTAKETLRVHQSTNSTHSLFILTGQSNITNTKTPLSLAGEASSLKYHTLLDAAALAPTTRISLEKTPVDAMAISFYKMFGYPTGVGALVVKKDFLDLLSRTKPWFAGGAVDVVQVPGELVTLADEVHERFEDGTINYLSLPAILEGLKFLDPLMPMLSARLQALTRYLTDSLLEMQYPSGRPCVRIVSRTYHDASIESERELGTGSIVSVLFLDEQEEELPLSFVSYCALEHNISLRTGCMCNPGGAAAMLGITYYMEHLEDGTRLKDLECLIGRELGVVRISLGLASNWDDVQQVLIFAKSLMNAIPRTSMMERWKNASAVLTH